MQTIAFWLHITESVHKFNQPLYRDFLPCVRYKAFVAGYCLVLLARMCYRGLCWETTSCGEAWSLCDPYKNTLTQWIFYNSASKSVYFLCESQFENWNISSESHSHVRKKLFPILTWNRWMEMIVIIKICIFHI